MSIAANQQRTFLRLLAQLRPHWRRDAALPVRLNALLAAHREFGSRDRRLYRELIYTTLRHLPWIEPLLDSEPDEAIRRIAWLAADLPATKSFRAEFAAGEPRTDDKTALLPAWFRAHCPEIFVGDELEAQLRRAPLWLRLQTDHEGERQVLDEFDSRGWEWRRTPILAGAIELVTEADVTKTESWKSGRIEIQDLGSQLILAAVGIEPGGKWLDACAGAGGKSLQLARFLGPAGRVVAHDIRAEALAELRARAIRAGAVYRPDEKTGELVEDREPINRSSGGKIGEATEGGRGPSKSPFALIEVTTHLSADAYDGVLVDAPCSGSGTWRRAPHLKWVTTEAQIAAAAEKQRALLEAFSEQVGPGGRLVYATCSLSRRENEEIVMAFLARQREFQAVPFANTFGASEREVGLTILPSLHNTDGFFVASLRRR